MKTLITKTIAVMFVAAMTTFAVANDGGFDRQAEFPELMAIQQEFAEQNVSHRLTLDSTAELIEVAIAVLNTTMDDVELANELSYLEMYLALHLAALDKARSDFEVLFDKAKQAFADYGTTEDVEPIEPEIIKTQYEKLNGMKFGVGKPEPAHRKTDAGTAIAVAHDFLVTLELSYRRINHHIEAAELLFVSVRKLSTALNTAIADDCEKIITTSEFRVTNYLAQILKHPL